MAQPDRNTLTAVCSHDRRVQHDLRLGWRHVDDGTLCEGDVNLRVSDEEVAS